MRNVATSIELALDYKDHNLEMLNNRPGHAALSQSNGFCTVQYMPRYSGW